MSKLILVISLIGLFAFQSHAQLRCETDSGGPLLTPIGIVVTTTTYELHNAEGQIGSDFETYKSCQNTIAKMKTDRPFVCLPLGSGFSGAVSRFFSGGSYAVFGPAGKRYGMAFTQNTKSTCEEIAIQGTRKGVCTAMPKILNYFEMVDGKEVIRTREVFDGYELWGSGSKTRFTSAKDCLSAGKKLLDSSSSLAPNLGTKKPLAVR